MIAEVRIPIDEAFKVLHSGQPYSGPLPDADLSPTLKERVKGWF